jgi:hypothetical protein
VTPDDVRRIALGLPEAAESAHMGHPDFRVRGRIFATLRPDEGRAVVKLVPDEQEILVGAEPSVFLPVAGAWGRQGWTSVILEPVDEAALRSALTTAWRNAAPKRLRAQFDQGA